MLRLTGIQPTGAVRLASSLSASPRARQGMKHERHVVYGKAFGKVFKGSHVYLVEACSRPVWFARKFLKPEHIS